LPASDDGRAVHGQQAAGALRPQVSSPHTAASAPQLRAAAAFSAACSAIVSCCPPPFPACTFSGTLQPTLSLPLPALAPCSCRRRVCLVLEEFVRLLHHCGMSLTELDICNGRGATVNEIMAQGEGCWGLSSRVGGCQLGACYSGLGVGGLGWVKLYALLAASNCGVAVGHCSQAGQGKAQQPHRRLLWRGRLAAAQQHTRRAGVQTGLP
jgi:hypothetical protein